MNRITTCKITARVTARIIFLIGLLLMFFGSAFLLGTLEGTTRFSILRAFFFVIIGALCAFFAIKLNKRSIYLFFAAFFLLVGFFLFLSALHIIPFSFSQLWPLLSIFAGLALLPAGWRHFGSFRSRYVVPSVVFVLLGCTLMLFSFRMVPFSFKHFVISWWPLLVVLIGLILVLLSLGTKNNSEHNPEVSKP
jgi:cell division protein FtsW (lipid II flippase)